MSIIIDSLTSEFADWKIVGYRACQFHRRDCFRSTDILLVMSLHDKFSKRLDLAIAKETSRFMSFRGSGCFSQLSFDETS